MGLMQSTASTYRCALCRARDFDPFFIHLPNDLACYFERGPQQPTQPVRPASTGTLGSALIGGQRKQVSIDVTRFVDQLAMLDSSTTKPSCLDTPFPSPDSFPLLGRSP
jgi:hypothetical protein